MRFLSFLLNIFDIFTLLAIAYAYYVNQDTPLKIPFLFACIVIYIATRLGIFAGQIIGMLGGQVGENVEDVNDADAYAKRLVWTFVPQLIGVIVFQILMAFCYLPNFPGLPKIQQSQKQEVQLYNNDNKNDIAAEQQTPAVAEETPAVETAAAETKAEENFVNTENAVAAQGAAEPQPAKVATPRVRRTNTIAARIPAKKPETKEVSQTSTPAYTVRYDIPERTLNIAGVDKAEVNLNNVKPASTSSVQVPASTNNWTFTASTPAAQTSVPQTVSATAGSSTQPKRYPGDDNPINTSWGYYRTGKWAADAAKTLNDK